MNNQFAKSLRIVVAVATTGRPQILLRTIEEVTRQSRRADRIVVCPAREEDCVGLADRFAQVEIVHGGRGLPRQRNAILNVIGDCDVVVFFDDDFIPAYDFLEELETLMTAEPDVLVATGHVLADGIHSEGITFEDGLAILTADAANPTRDPARLEPRCTGYGCNMAIRLEPVFRNGMRFDERLPLYGWLEDLDFCAGLHAREPGSRVVWSSQLRGVHLGNKSGRQSGLRLGYSQVVNPLYIARKGAAPSGYVLKHIPRNIAANLVKSFAPEPHIDRLGRLKGNILGLIDVLRRRDDPAKIESMG